MDERLLKLIDKDTLEYVQNKNITIIGIGGVGSYALETLVRFGIKNITIIDKDIIDITNKNRQLIALDTTLNKKKVDVAKERIFDINSECNVTCYDVFLSKDNIPIVIDKNTDYILDCCDTVTTKIELIKYAKENKIDIISSMGTGNRLDPSLIRITDIYKTNYDPLAKIIRKLCRENNIESLDVVTSIEVPKKVTDRVVGSTPFVPSVAGITMASFVVNKFIKNSSK